jgi:OOP family OmpA-OmpF porin
MNKKIALLVATSLLAMASVASAGNKAGSLSFTPVVGAYLFDGKQHLEANVLYGARIGLNLTDALGVEALFDYTHNNETTTPSVRPGISMYRYGGELLYHFNPAGTFVPYLAAGYAGVNFDGNSDGFSDKRYRQTHGAFDYGIGSKIFMSDNIALRGDVRHIIYSYDRTYSNYEATVGVYFAFGGAAPAAKPVAKQEEPAPAPVVEPMDSDGDGVPDARDKCPGTPAGAAVDANGCPLDTDGDGVADYRDKCPGTPAGVAVDANGCPVDTDRDGVADYLDKCPGTPAGVTVDKDGCALDTDRDGVADYLDKCPGTPVGAAVDNNGCPLDTDMDGVPDYLDACPGTPAGVKVDKSGCPEAVVSIVKKEAAARKYCNKPAVLAINFDTNKSDIKPEYRDELKTLGEFLEYFPESKGEISGHADTTGPKALNQTLSQARADSVRKYLVDTFGIKASRIDTMGYGFSKPVASNKTKAGRAKNRRMEANFSCE